MATQYFDIGLRDDDQSLDDSRGPAKGDFQTPIRGKAGTINRWDKNSARRSSEANGGDSSGHYSDLNMDDHQYYFIITGSGKDYLSPLPFPLSFTNIGKHMLYDEPINSFS